MRPSASRTTDRRQKCRPPRLLQQSAEAARFFSFSGVKFDLGADPTGADERNAGSAVAPFVNLRFARPAHDLVKRPEGPFIGSAGRLQ